MNQTKAANSDSNDTSFASGGPNNMEATNAGVLDTLIVKDSQIYLKKYHVQRTFEAYQFLNLPSDLSQLVRIYSEIEKTLPEGHLIRIIFSEADPRNFKVEKKELTKIPQTFKLGAVKANHPLLAKNRFKFADRSHWKPLLNLKPEECDDILLLNSKEEVVETSRFNVFLYDEANSVALTPKIDSGCLNGVFRRFAVECGYLELPDGSQIKLVEKNFSLTEAQKATLFVGNSVRGLIPANLYR